VTYFVNYSGLRWCETPRLGLCRWQTRPDINPFCGPDGRITLFFLIWALSLINHALEMLLDINVSMSMTDM
jgi:hypothetical protein